MAGRWEPLLGVYRRSVAEAWGEALREEPSLRQVLARLRTRVLPESALRAVDAELRSVVSLNTPEDLERHGASLPTTRW